MSKEIDYQNKAQNCIEQLISQRTGITTSMYTEEFDTTYNYALQDDTWIITQSLPQFQIVGLRDKIKELNQLTIAKSIQDFGLNLTVDAVVDAMVQDFADRFEKARNGYETYPLIFTPNTLQKTNDHKRIAKVGGVDFSYDVIYYEWMNRLSYQGKNAFSFVREKRIEIPGQGTSHQRPDFAVYINGIPILFIEYKTEESGLKEAIADLENKSTYRKVPFYVATNGHECAVICNIEQFNMKDDTGANAYLWKATKSTPDIAEPTDVECFYHEVLCQPEHLYFYITQVTSLDHIRQIVKNGRVQQYQAVKNFHRHLEATRRLQQRTPANLAVFHTQRSGKTMTMKFMAQLVLNHYNDVFEYIFIYAPDLQIKKILVDEIKAAGNQSLVQIDTIGGDSSLTFEHALKQMHANAKKAAGGVKRIFIVNMQQLKIASGKPFTGFNVLNIIDEGHHGQAGEHADVRNRVLPNATNVLFTATPKESTYANYIGVDPNNTNVLDRFTFSQAKAADIVVNVLYLKPTTLTEALKRSGKLGEFLDRAEKELGRKFDDDAQAFDTISNYEEDPVFSNAAKRIFAKGWLEKLHQDIVPLKIKHLVDFQQEVKASLTHEGQVLFEPKAIVYTQDIAQAKAYIDAVRKLNGGVGNVYRGLRFGLDYAALDQATSLLENDGIGVERQGDAPSPIEMAFRQQDAGVRIDVLIAVNKYQKGYDLPELTTVFLDKTIQEPSLINQIYTRPATKRRYKTVGYCVDLTLGNINRQTFNTSVQLYDDGNQGAEQFITEETITQIQNAVNAALAVLKVRLGLDATTFTKERILQAVLNPSSDAERQPRQAVFFQQSKLLFKHIDRLKSPLYFKPQKAEISALYRAFVEFKDIYADTKHPEHGKIKINLDSSLADAYLTKQEIQSIIANVLGVMKEKSLATLLDFQYSNAKDMFSTGESAIALTELVNAQKKEERKADLIKAIKLTESFLEEKDKTLYDLVKALLDKLSDDRTAIYNVDVQNEIIDFLARVQAHQAAFQTELNTKYGGSAFVYYTVDGLQRMYPLLDAVAMLSAYLYVAGQIYDVYRKTISTLTHHLTVQEKIKECAHKMANNSTVKFTFQLGALLLNYVESLEPEQRKAFWPKLLVDLQAQGCAYEQFKQLPLDGEFLEEVITKVHKLQGHF